MGRFCVYIGLSQYAATGVAAALWQDENKPIGEFSFHHTAKAGC